MSAMTIGRADIDEIDVGCHRFPTPEPESDGTLDWRDTTAVTVSITAGAMRGLGWTYSSSAAATVITDHLRPLLLGHNAYDVGSAWTAMHRACRNLGTKGLVMQAISAVDIALWDVKARLLGTPLVHLFGQHRERIPIYGSGGFTSSSDAQLSQDIAAWKAAGCTAMKIKIGRNAGTQLDWDRYRVLLFHELAGDGIALMVDANGAYDVGTARRIGTELDELGVTWFEEPVSSDDSHGLDVVRASVRCDVTAGEYISDGYDVQRLAPVVDCLQLDVTRCGGYTGFLRGAAVAAAHNLDVSAHCAPALHAPVVAAIPNLRHLEWFNDHVRLEPELADGVPAVDAGALVAPTGVTGHGMSLVERSGA